MAAKFKGRVVSTNTHSHTHTESGVGPVVTFSVDLHVIIECHLDGETREKVPTLIRQLNCTSKPGGSCVQDAVGVQQQTDCYTPETFGCVNIQRNRGWRKIFETAFLCVGKP